METLNGNHELQTGHFLNLQQAAKIAGRHRIPPNQRGTGSCRERILSPEFPEPQTPEGRPRGEGGEGRPLDLEKYWQHAFPGG